jgi:predicted DNA-binding transcriptional regulator YafY
MTDNIKRLPRLTAILTLLQTKKIVTATELAKKFGISVRTVYRDIRALEQSGIPIVTEEGIGYSLMEGYKLPPIMFTEKEANALITAEQFVLRSKDSSLVKEFSEAIAKIKSVLRYSNKEKAELLAERVYFGRNFDAQVTSQSLTDIQLALTNFQLVRITYETPDAKTSERTIEPFALYNSPQEDWTLAAYCRLRKDFRSFRLDRMKKVELLDGFFEPHKLTIEEYLKRNRKGN